MLSESFSSAIPSFVFRPSEDPEMVVALDGHESLVVFGPRVIWLAGIFCHSRVLGTNMRCELLVASLSEVRLHLLNGFAGERP